jgi:hypothetical protein
VSVKNNKKLLKQCRMLRLEEDMKGGVTWDTVRRASPERYWQGWC